MSHLAIELSDAGIMAAGGTPPRLLAVDGPNLESPGYALPDKRLPSVGISAQGQAQIQPLAIQTRFWDQLNTDPLKNRAPATQSHAELAWAHLRVVWETIRPFGTEVVITVPGFFTRHQLGLLLGIAHELSMPVGGFVAQPVASARPPLPQGRLVYVNVHLHRTEVALLGRDERLSATDAFTIDEFGLLNLQRTWVESVAEEFVRATRFDPLHAAASEQELFDRLPGVMAHLEDNSAVTFELRPGRAAHQITLNPDLFARRTQPYFSRVADGIRSLLDRPDPDPGGPVLLLGHRFARLPGLRAFLADLDHPAVVALSPGASALHALDDWTTTFRGAQPGKEADYFTSRPWPPTETRPVAARQPEPEPDPTHLLYRDRAYPVGAGLRYICAVGTEGLTITGRPGTGAEPVCSVQRVGGRMVLKALDPSRARVDDAPVAESTVLRLGQSITPWPAADPVRAIVCVDEDET